MKCKGLLFLLLSGGLSSFAQQPVISAVDSNLVKTLFFAGLSDKLSENYTNASESFSKILAIDPNNAAVYYEIATMNYRQNKLPEAETAIKKAIALDKNNMWYWKLMAELYKRKGDMNALIEVFNQLIRISPENDAYYFDRSNAWLLAGNAEEALKGYNELERKFGPSEDLSEARQKISAEKNKGLTQQELDKLLSEEVKDVKDLLRTGSMLIEKGQDKAALSVLKKAKLIDPDNFEIDLALAGVYESLKDEPNSNAALKQAFGNFVMPVDQKVKLLMMLFEEVKGRSDIDNLLEFARVVVKLQPNDPKVLAMYGDMLYRKGDLNAALDQFSAVLKITDQMYVAWERTLNIQTNLGLYKEAVKTGDEALSIYPNQAILYYYMAFALLNDAQYDMALTNIKMALQLDELNPQYIACYGDVLFLKGNKDAALQQWKKAKAAGNDSEKLKEKIDEQKYIK